MFTILPRVLLFVSILSIPLVGGCGGDEPTIVGGPTPEIMAELEKNKSRYAESMKEPGGN